MLWVDWPEERFQVVTADPGELYDIFDRDFQAIVRGDYEICRLSGVDYHGNWNICIAGWKNLVVSWSSDEHTSTEW